MRSMGPTGNHWRNVVRCAATKALKEERNMSPPLKNFTAFQAEFGYSCAKLRGMRGISSESCMQRTRLYDGLGVWF